MCDRVGVLNNLVSTSGLGCLLEGAGGVLVEIRWVFEGRGLAMRTLRGMVFSMSMLWALMPTANAQSLVGQISGAVIDPSGIIVPGATVLLPNQFISIWTFTKI